MKVRTTRALLALLIPAAALAAALAFHLSTPWVEGPSPYAGDGLAGAWARVDSPAGMAAEWLTIQAGSPGGTWRECGRPVLEVLGEEGWQSLKAFPGTYWVLAMGLAVAPGESKEFTLDTGRYGPRLAPGRYRAVFDMGAGDYVAAEFEVESTPAGELWALIRGPVWLWWTLPWVECVLAGAAGVALLWAGGRADRRGGALPWVLRGLGIMMILLTLALFGFSYALPRGG